MPRHFLRWGDIKSQIFQKYFAYQAFSFVGVFHSDLFFPEQKRKHWSSVLLDAHSKVPWSTTGWITVTKSPKTRSPVQNRERQSWGWNRNRDRSPEAEVEKGTGADLPEGNVPSFRRTLGGRAREHFSSSGITSALWTVRHDDSTCYSCSGVRAPAMRVKKQYVLYFWLVTGKLTGYCLWSSYCPSDQSPAQGNAWR